VKTKATIDGNARKPGRVAARRDQAVGAAKKKAAAPAVVLSAAAVLQAEHAPAGWLISSAAGLALWYARDALDARFHRRSGGKRAARARRKFQGTATSRELSEKLSLTAARKRAKVTRPSYNGHTRRLSPAEAGVAIGTAGTPSRTCYGTHEDFYAAFGIARRGKTGWMAGRVLDAPGACAAFTTRTDLREHTVIARAERGPVYDLNPGGEGKVRTNFGLSPLEGCWHPQAAIESAGYLVHAAPSDKGKDAHWDAAGCDLLRLMMHAAAIVGASMRDVAAWVRDPASKEPLTILAGHPYAAPGWAHELAEMTASPGDYLSGVIASARSALRWMADPVMAAIACPEESGLPVLDPEKFLLSRATLYVTGTNRPHNSMAPYNAWLCARLFDTTKRMAAEMPGSRMDPPLMLVPDEPALTCPVPLDRWCSEAGGWGITIITGFQSRSQLNDLYGENGARTLWNNAGVKPIFGGFTDETHLEAFSRVCGTRDTWHQVKNPDGTKTRQPATEPLFPPERIRLIGDKKTEALILHHRTRPFVAEPQMVWDLPGYRRAQPGWAPPAPAAPEPLAIEAPRRREAIPMPGAAPAVTDATPSAIEENDTWQKETPQPVTTRSLTG
jgi:type IV secretion system protein VirD4